MWKKIHDYISVCMTCLTVVLVVLLFFFLYSQSFADCRLLIACRCKLYCCCNCNCIDFHRQNWVINWNMWLFFNAYFQFDIVSHLNNQRHLFINEPEKKKQMFRCIDLSQFTVREVDRCVQPRDTAILINCPCMWMYDSHNSIENVWFPAIILQTNNKNWLLYRNVFIFYLFVSSLSQRSSKQIHKQWQFIETFSQQIHYSIAHPHPYHHWTTNTCLFSQDYDKNRVKTD